MNCPADAGFSSNKMSRAKQYDYERIDLKRESQDQWYLQRRKELADEDGIVQTQLEISHPGDAHEVQADNVARNFVNGADANVSDIIPASSSLQTRSESFSLHIDSDFNSLLDSTKGSGESLDEFTRNEMESKMGADLSKVRVHTGSAAHALSESINAKAFTHGQDVYFKNGNYDTNTNQGRELLAHEVVHTVQQGMGVSRKIQRSPSTDPIKNWLKEKLGGRNVSSKEAVQAYNYVKGLSEESRTELFKEAETDGELYSLLDKIWSELPASVMDDPEFGYFEGLEGDSLQLNATIAEILGDPTTWKDAALLDLVIAMVLQAGLEDQLVGIVREKNWYRLPDDVQAVLKKRGFHPWKDYRDKSKKRRRRGSHWLRMTLNLLMRSRPKTIHEGADRGAYEGTTARTVVYGFPLAIFQKSWGGSYYGVIFSDIKRKDRADKPDRDKFNTDKFDVDVIVPGKNTISMEYDKTQGHFLMNGDQLLFDGMNFLFTDSTIRLEEGALSKLKGRFYWATENKTNVETNLLEIANLRFDNIRYITGKETIAIGSLQVGGLNIKITEPFGYEQELKTVTAAVSRLTFFLKDSLYILINSIYLMLDKYIQGFAGDAGKELGELISRATSSFNMEIGFSSLYIDNIITSKYGLIKNVSAGPSAITSGIRSLREYYTGRINDITELALTQNRKQTEQEIAQIRFYESQIAQEEKLITEIGDLKRKLTTLSPQSYMFIYKDILIKEDELKRLRAVDVSMGLQDLKISGIDLKISTDQIDLFALNSFYQATISWLEKEWKTIDMEWEVRQDRIEYCEKKIELNKSIIGQRLALTQELEKLAPTETDKRREIQKKIDELNTNVQPQISFELTRSKTGHVLKGEPVIADYIPGVYRIDIQDVDIIFNTLVSPDKGALVNTISGEIKSITADRFRYTTVGGFVIDSRAFDAKKTDAIQFSGIHLNLKEEFDALTGNRSALIITSLGIDIISCNNVTVYKQGEENKPLFVLPAGDTLAFSGLKAVNLALRMSEEGTQLLTASSTIQGDASAGTFQVNSSEVGLHEDSQAGNNTEKLFSAAAKLIFKNLEGQLGVHTGTISLSVSEKGEKELMFDDPEVFIQSVTTSERYEGDRGFRSYKKVQEVLDATTNTPILKADSFKIIVRNPGDEPEYILVRPEFDQIDIKFYSKYAHNAEQLDQPKPESGKASSVTWFNEKEGKLKATVDGNIRMYQNEAKDAWILVVETEDKKPGNAKLTEGEITAHPNSEKARYAEHSPTHEANKEARQFDILDQFEGTVNVFLFEKVIPVKVEKGGYVAIASLFNKVYNAAYQQIEDSLFAEFKWIADQLYTEINQWALSLGKFIYPRETFNKDINGIFDLVKGLSFKTQIKEGHLQAVIYRKGKPLSSYNLAKDEKNNIDRSQSKVKLSALVEFRNVTEKGEGKAESFTEATVGAILDEAGDVFSSTPIAKWVEDGVNYAPAEAEVRKIATALWDDVSGWDLTAAAIGYLTDSNFAALWSNIAENVAEKITPFLVKRVVWFLKQANIHLDLAGKYHSTDVGSVQIKKFVLDLNEQLAPQIEVTGLQVPAFSQKLINGTFSSDGVMINHATFFPKDLRFNDWKLNVHNAEVKAPKLTIPIQKKSLSIGSPNDPLEHEADAIASKVARGQNADLTGVSRFFSGVQRKEKEEEAPLDLVDSLSASVGHSMDHNTRAEMESRMGMDFSGVKIHTDGPADVMNQQVNAHAFTLGQSVFFRKGNYNPATSVGKELLAHELVHTVQQGDGSDSVIFRKWVLTPPGADPVAEGSIENGIDMVIDGDADQEKELVLTFKRNPAEQMPDVGELYINNYFALEEKGPIYLKIPGVDWKTFYIVQTQKTDGKRPAEIQLLDEPFYLSKKEVPAERKIFIYPPSRLQDQGNYSVGQGNNPVFKFSFAHEFGGSSDVMHVIPDSESAVGFPSIEFKAGFYQDIFRLMVEENKDAQASAPAGKYIYNLYFTGINDSRSGFAFNTFPKFVLTKPISGVSFKLIDSGISYLSFDLDGDGIIDLTIYTSMTQTFSHMSAAEDRKIEFQLYGPSFQSDGLQYIFNKAGGRFRFKATTDLESFYDKTAVKVPSDLAQAREFVSMELELGILNAQLDLAYEEIQPLNIVNANNFSLWKELAPKMFQLLFVVAKDPHPSAQHDQFIEDTAALADKFYTAFKTEVNATGKGNDTWGGYGSAGYRNRYTHETGMGAMFYSSSSELQLKGHIKARNWAEAQWDFYRLSSGYNLWVADELKIKDPSKKELADRLAATSAQLNTLTDLYADPNICNLRRVRNVYYAFEGLNGASNTTPLELPLYYYFNKSEHKWYIKNFIRTENPFKVQQTMDDSYIPGPTDAPPLELFQELNHKEHLPQGIIYFQLQSGTNGTVKLTNYVSPQEVLGAAALAFAALGLIIFSAGAATPLAAGLVALCFYTSAALTIAGAIYDMYDAIEHGQLTATRLFLNLLDIATSLLQLKLTQLGRIAMVKGVSALTKVQQGVYFSLKLGTSSLEGVQLGVLGYDAWVQIEAIQNGPGRDEDKSRAIATLLSKFIITGTFWVLDLRGSKAKADFDPDTPGDQKPLRIHEFTDINGKQVRMAFSDMDIEMGDAWFLRGAKSLHAAQFTSDQVIGISEEAMLHLKAADNYLMNGQMDLAITELDAFRAKTSGLSITQDQFDLFESSLAGEHGKTDPKIYRTKTVTYNEYINSTWSDVTKTKKAYTFGTERHTMKHGTDFDLLKKELGLNVDVTTQAGQDALIDALFKNGLPARGGNTNLSQHASARNNSAFRGTCETYSSPGMSDTGPVYWAGEGGLIIEIKNASGWDLDEVLGSTHPTHGEHEIAILAGVPSANIVGVKYVKKGYKTGSMIHNPYNK